MMIIPSPLGRRCPTGRMRGADLANAYVEEQGKLAAVLNMTGAGKNRLFLEKRIAEAT